jgi:hypothetical protein
MEWCIPREREAVDPFVSGVSQYPQCVVHFDRKLNLHSLAVAKITFGKVSLSALSSFVD